MCFDPFGETNYHLGGNVVHSIHNSNIGETPIIPSEYKKYLFKNIIKNPELTNNKKFIESAETFFPDIKKSEFIGSMYTIRNSVTL